MQITVRVKPGSAKGPLVIENPGPADGSARRTADDADLTVFLRERAVDGQANHGLVAVLAKHYAVPKSSISIVRGTSSPLKRVSIER